MRLCELDTTPIAIEHRCEPPADAAVIELHILRGTERLEHDTALRRRKPAKIELVVIAQEHSPLRRWRPRSRRIHGPYQGAAVSRGERKEQCLVDLKVEHHVHAIAAI